MRKERSPSGAPGPEEAITVLRYRPSPQELLARGRRLREELRVWIADLARLPTPDDDGTICEQSPGWLLIFLCEQMRSILEAR